MAGRNIVFDEAARAEFLAAMEDGCIDAECCARAGVAPSTVYWWLEAGRKNDGTAYGKRIGRDATLEEMVDFSQQFARMDPLRRRVRREKIHDEFQKKRHDGFKKREVKVIKDADGNVEKTIETESFAEMSESTWMWYLKTQFREEFDDRHSVVVEGSDLSEEEMRRIVELIKGGKVGISDQGAIRDGNISVARRVLREHELEG